MLRLPLLLLLLLSLPRRCIFFVGSSRDEALEQRAIKFGHFACGCAMGAGHSTFCPLNDDLGAEQDARAPSEEAARQPAAPARRLSSEWHRLDSRPRVAASPPPSESTKSKESTAGTSKTETEHTR